MTYPKVGVKPRPRTLMTRLRKPKAPNRVLFGSISKMILALEEDIPGAGHWLLDQVPEGTTMMDLLKAIIVDVYYEDHAFVEKKEET